MIQFAENSMRGMLKELWKECFGDIDEYVNLFFENHDASRHTLVFIDGVTPVSMLSMLPMTVVTQGGILPARYMYALATKQSYRRRGIGAKMIEEAHKHMKRQGIKLSILVPASTDLYHFYEKLGYDTAFYSGCVTLSSSQIKQFNGSFNITESSTEEFMQMRERAFAGRTMFVRWDGEALAYRLAETMFYGGETLIISTASGKALAVCCNDGGVVTIKELALDGVPIEDVISILQQKYNADEYNLRLPTDIECPYRLELAASATACWYDSDAKRRVMDSQGAAPYISLVLD